MLSSLALLSLFSFSSAQAGSIELWSMDDFGDDGSEQEQVVLHGAVAG